MVARPPRISAQARFGVSGPMVVVELFGSRLVGVGFIGLRSA
ncbi:hypothetical protein BH10PSE11_BH10PSE11_27140 [soil metagenome]